MFLSRENLAIHAVASTEEARYALTGIYVDPQRNVTAASDGKRLVEITAPSVDPKKYPPAGVTGACPLANGETKPFILPAKAAQELLKILPKGKGEKDLTQYAALAKSKDDKLSIVTLDGKKANLFAFDPIDGRFPDYAGVFPKESPQASVRLNAEILRQTLKTATLGEAIALHVYKDGTIAIVNVDGEKRRFFAVGPFDGQSHNHDAVFPKDSPQASVYLDPELLQGMLKAATLSEAITLHVYPTPMAQVESEAPNGTKSRGLLMGLDSSKVQGASTSKAEAKSPDATKPAMEKEETVAKVSPKTVQAPTAPASKPESAMSQSKATDERTGAKKRGGFRGYRRWKGGKEARPQALNGGATPRQPSPAQRAFHTYLLKSRGEDITLFDLKETNVSDKIDELKSRPSVDESFATWPQWRKLFLTLAEKQVAFETVREILNGLTSIKDTSSTIDTWVKKDATPAVATPASAEVAAVKQAA